MSNQGVFSVARGKNLGEARRGEDDDGDPVVQGQTTKVQIDNRYFDRLKERLAAAGVRQAGVEPVTTGEPGGAEEEPAGHADARDSGPVIYNDDGSIYKRPG